MNTVYVSQTEKTDFSIARILGKDQGKKNGSLSPNESIHFLQHMKEVDDDRSKGRWERWEEKVIYRKCKGVDEDDDTVSNKMSKSEDELLCHGEALYQNVQTAKMCEEGRKQSSSSVSTGVHEISRHIKTTELMWLQYTRYRPPKFPRRTVIGKGTKRRSGVYPRIPFSSYQLQILEDRYKRSAYLAKNDVAEISALLRLPQNKVRGFEIFTYYRISLSF
ncbi:hypothetical protein KM043_009776 [Ampulex compressa]|nr:hypothetical protein KM043_009776 [Ampulex compressa]